MKKISLVLLTIVLFLTVFAACHEKAPAETTDGSEVTTGGNETLSPDSGGETDSSDGEENPFGLDETLNGWFEQGGALIYRDKYTYVGTRDSMSLSMAKNEMEGFQYILLSGTDYEGLRLEVSALSDGKGNTLEGTVFTAYNYCIRNTAGWIERGYVPELLMPQDDPYQGGTFDVVAGRAKTMYVRYQTDKNTVPGTYTGTLEIKQGDAVLLTHKISVKVWDIYYDEKTECLTIYQYGYCRDDLGWGGPGPEGAPNMDAAVADNAFEVRQQYVDFMLEHRLSPWSIPVKNELLDEDFELVKKYMDNPRLTLTYLNWSNNPEMQAEIARENGWFDKLACMLGDEPTHSEVIDYFRDVASDLYARTGITRYNTAFYTGFSWSAPADGPNVAERMSEYSTLYTIKSTNLNRGDPVAETLWRLKRERGDTVLWYVCGSQDNRSDVVNFLVGTPCTEKRILFWQQYQNDVDGYLQFHTMVWNRKYDFWAEDYEDHKWKPVTNIDGGDGDGMMIYWHPVTKEPIGSLTLEANRDGIEDFQLLRMAEELLGKDVAMSYAERITTAVNVYIKNADVLAQVRSELGDAVEAALR